MALVLLLVVRSRRERAGGHHASRRNRTGADRKSGDVAPVRTEQGGSLDESIVRHHAQRSTALAPILHEPLFGRRLRVGHRVHHITSAPTTPWTFAARHVLRLQADRSPVPGAATLSPHRRAVGPRRLARSDAGRLLRLRRPPASPTTTAPTTPSSSRTRRRCSRCGRRAGCSCCAAASRSLSGSRRLRRKVTAPRLRLFTRPATFPGLGDTARLSALTGNDGHRLAFLPWLRATRRVLRRHVPRLHRHQDSQFGFEQLDYEAIQHVPILRDAWVLSFHGLVHTSYAKTGQQMPFFMMPAVGGGSELRASSSWRFRDQNTVLLQAEWRVMASRFLDIGRVLRRRQGDDASIGSQPV